jgi:type II secretory pathway pseudopilin PulG
MSPMRAMGRTDGFTVVEVMVAALVLALSALAVMGLVDATSRSNLRSQQSQVVSSRLQQEMEAIKQLPYSKVGLTSLPAHSIDAADPDYRVSGSQFNVSAGGAPANWNLVYNGGHSNETGAAVGGGTIDPGPTTFQNGNVKGKIYRYVVWKPESNCTNCAHEANSDSYLGHQVTWFKHVIVVVTLDQTASGGTRTYQELHSDIGNPDAGQGSGSCCGTSNDDKTPWTFWLTDTPCDNDTRQPIDSDHLTHDTLGACSKGMTTGRPGQDGANAGAPDLMFTQPAPCVNNDCTTTQPLHDYATDIEPGCGTVNCASDDKGLQELLPTNVLNGGSCATDLNALTTGGLTSLLSLGADPQWYVHKWVSAETPSNWNNILLSGTGTLNLWTQTVGGASYSGRICVWLFTRHLIESVPVDTVAVNATTTDACNASRTISANLVYFPCTYSSWPSGAWTEIHIPLKFSTLTLPAGDRLGLAIGVERQGTGGSGLQFMYDAPTYDSRLEVNTTSALPF